MHSHPPSFSGRTLAVIGAGPKGIAVALKAKVLAEFGLPADRVVLVERNGVAANWTGEFGYTNGEMKLGTSPEKDVVFPLETDVGDPHLNERIRLRLLQFTWTSFLSQTGRFSDWIDRGRPAPCHQLWAQYLYWVSEQLGPQVTFIRDEVVSVDLSPDGALWELRLRNTDPGFIHADRLLLTGPGKTRLDFLADSSLPDGAFDLESFWRAIKDRSFPTGGKVAIVGAGENAAATLLALAQYAPALRLDVVSPKGFISTRAESFYENQVYSQPERNHWTEMDLADRIDFIARTDLGVFSVQAMNVLNDQVRHRIVAGRVVGLKKENGALNLRVEYRRKIMAQRYDQVIFATGFDQVEALKNLLSARALGMIQESLRDSLSNPTLAGRIKNDLSVPGVVPALHLPMLAGLTQGPGFANLSCLGRLSDRIVTLPALEALGRIEDEPMEVSS